MFGHLLWLLLHVSMSVRCEAERVPCARILFKHIPKTGGESVKATLRKSFPSFNFLDHRSYGWKSLHKREVRKGFVKLFSIKLQPLSALAIDEPQFSSLRNTPLHTSTSPGKVLLLYNLSRTPHPRGCNEAVVKYFVYTISSARSEVELETF